MQQERMGWELGGTHSHTKLNPEQHHIIKNSAGDCSPPSAPPSIAHFCGLTCRTSHATTAEPAEDVMWMGRQSDRDGEYYKVQDTCKEFDLYLFVSLVSPSFVFTFLHSNRVDLNHVENGIQGSLVSLEDAAAPMGTCIWFPAAAPPLRRPLLGAMLSACLPFVIRQPLPPSTVASPFVCSPPAQPIVSVLFIQLSPLHIIQTTTTTPGHCH